METFAKLRFFIPDTPRFITKLIDLAEPNKLNRHKTFGHDSRTGALVRQKTKECGEFIKGKTTQ